MSYSLFRVRIFKNIEHFKVRRTVMGFTTNTPHPATTQTRQVPGRGYLGTKPPQGRP